MVLMARPKPQRFFSRFADLSRPTIPASRLLGRRVLLRHQTSTIRPHPSQRFNEPLIAFTAYGLGRGERRVRQRAQHMLGVAQ